MIKNYQNFKNSLLIKEEASPKIPNSIEYWTNKGKDGKNVMLYFHDDMDGLMSGIAIKKYLLSKGFKIIGYGVVNYQESWDVITLNPKYINVAVDFAEYKDGIDVYIDHHGEFSDTDKEGVKGKGAIKTKTYSAYEGIMDQLGLPTDKMVVDVITMIDSAKYNEFNIDWTELLSSLDLSKIKNHENPKLMFAGIFNQYLKRSDFRTFIEVVHNATETSIYQIFNLFKSLYPMNNIDFRTMKKIREMDSSLTEYDVWKMDQTLFKDFVEDGSERLDQMSIRTKGAAEFKGVIRSQQELVDKYRTVISYSETSRSVFAGQSSEVIQLDGYVLIGELIFVPSGTWANAIRARSIVESDIKNGRLKDVKKEDIKWILLQYGDTLQMCSFDDVENYDETTLPKTKEGDIINNLKVYTNELLKRFRTKLGFINDNTRSGGHTGIGTISNIGVKRFYYIGEEKGMGKLGGLRFLDLFKNYIIANLSQIPWDISLNWENPFRPETEDKVTPIDARVMYINQIRKVDINKSKDVSFSEDYEHKKSLSDLIKSAELLKLEQERIEEERKDREEVDQKLKHQFYINKREDNKSYEEWKEEQKIKKNVQ